MSGGPGRTVALLTASDRSARGEYEDRSGPLLARLIQERTPWKVVEQAICPDDADEIARRLADWCTAGVSLIITTGGTGFGPRDVTPEATRRVIQREAPGIAEALRAASLQITQHAMLSRGVAGIRDGSLIINLPGNPKAVREGLDLLLPVLPHALDLVADDDHPESRHRVV